MLVKVVHVSVKDLDKQFDRRRRLHARVGDAEGALETLENTLTVAVQLRKHTDQSAYLGIGTVLAQGVSQNLDEMLATHIALLRLFIRSNRRGPPQVTSQVDRAALVGLAQ